MRPRRDGAGEGVRTKRAALQAEAPRRTRGFDNRRWRSGAGEGVRTKRVALQGEAPRRTRGFDDRRWRSGAREGVRTKRAALQGKAPRRTRGFDNRGWRSGGGEEMRTPDHTTQYGTHGNRAGACKVATWGLSEAGREAVEKFRRDVVEPSMTSLVI